ncbi:MAG TPA: penicillin acylase family protein [Bryobacteraceae bacterium]|nr:penicillin acylase family protein [Bryobacteraceae bacterium]
MAIAVALAAALIGVYWFVWRPLPVTSGSLTAPIEAQATVTRDALGVPHISAASEQDALFLQGFVTAQDRLWQMDAIRRLAAGELAEIVGPGALNSDREARQMRVRRVAEEHYKAITQNDRTALAAYAGGVNFFIETHRRQLPIEFTLLRYEPRPWSVVDTILSALQMESMLSSMWKIELRKENLLAGGDRQKVEALFPVRSGSEFQPGSNAWAIAGSRTATGKALLAGDPHLEYSVPGTWYMVHLKAPGLNVSGVSLPGLPGVIIGHNERIAWSVTNLQFDVQDLYVEKFDPAGGSYVYRGQVETARPEREVIRVRDGRPEQLVTWVTRNGPIFLSQGGRYLSVRWAPAESGGFQYPILDLDRACNWGEFRAALARLPAPGSNFVYADLDGNIGYQAAGRFPIRANYSGDVPVDGSFGEFEWRGFIPFEQLPSVFNPASGIIISANQNPFPEDYPYRVGGNFSSPYRANQIRARLSSRKGWSTEDTLRLQTDEYSAFHHYLAREIAAACGRRGAKGAPVDEAAKLLRDFDGQMRNGSAAALIAELASQHVCRALAERASPGKGVVYSYEMSRAVVERLLRTRPPEWAGDWDKLLVSNLANAIAEGQRTQGRDVTKWDYGRYNQLGINHPIAGQLPLAGKYFNFGPVPFGGAPTTVKQVRFVPRVGPSMRMVVDFSDLDRSVLNIPFGQSGQVLSRHYRDQWKSYLEGRSFRMQFRNIEAKETLRFTPTEE